MTAVKDVSLEIADREFVVLVGPSGCGKSTTLRMIAGLEEISQGDIYIGDKRVNDVAPKDRDIAMVFQNYALYPHMSRLRQHRLWPEAAEISEGGNQEARRGRGEHSRHRSAARSQTEGALRRPAAARRGRPRHRAAAEGLPLRRTALESRRQDAGADADRNHKLHQRLQATMIYVTHDQIEAMTMGDRIVVMNEGVVQQNDAPLTLYNEPVNLFVAGFLGSPPMNFIHRHARRQRRMRLFSRNRKAGPIEVAFPGAERPAAREFIGQDDVLGIRPEDIEVATFPQGRRSAPATGFPGHRRYRRADGRGDESLPSNRRPHARLPEPGSLRSPGGRPPVAVRDEPGEGASFRSRLDAIV